jgi:hypothetical protein
MLQGQPLAFLEGYALQRLIEPMRCHAPGAQVAKHRGLAAGYVVVNVERQRLAGRRACFAGLC